MTQQAKGKKDAWDNAKKAAKALRDKRMKLGEGAPRTEEEALRAGRAGCSKVPAVPPPPPPERHRRRREVELREREPDVGWRDSPVRPASPPRGLARHLPPPEPLSPPRGSSVATSAAAPSVAPPVPAESSTVSQSSQAKQLIEHSETVRELGCLRRVAARIRRRLQKKGRMCAWVEDMGRF